ncbi:MAG: ankyrin repeat domain-containing protein [Elusimicrobia bacterium]|nr:ankyrin repeat domain-containing protein [Elusimicrobiota bacterium]
MKKIISLFICIFMAAAAFAWTDFSAVEQQIQQLKQNPNPNPVGDTVKLYYFTFEKCPWCKLFEKSFFNDFYATYKETYKGKLEIIKVDILEGCNGEVYKNALLLYAPGKLAGVPAIIVGGTYILGPDHDGKDVTAAIDKAIKNHEQTKVSLNAECEKDLPPLIRAVKESDLAKVKTEYAKAPQSLALTDETGQTALMWAVLSGNHEIAKFLISVTPKENIDQADKYGETALLCTVKGNGDNIEIAKLLIAKGASMKGLLDGATTYPGNEEIFDIAIQSVTAEEMAELNVPSEKKHWNILLSAANTSQLYKAKKLIEAGAVVYESQRETIDEATKNSPEMKALLLSVIQPDPVKQD